MMDNQKTNFTCLLIGNTDSFGNKFNGYDLQKYLNEKHINANCFVKLKQTSDENIFFVPGLYAQLALRSDLFSLADVIHMNLIHATDFDLAYLPFYSALKPCVITLHDAFFTTGHCVHSFDCLKWKNSCHDCKKLDIMLQRKTDTSALEYKIKKDVIQNSQISAIVASDYMENLVKQSPIWEGKKIYKVPFGINQEIFKPAIDKNLAKKRLGIDSNSIVLMFRSSKNEFKGLHLIKKALDNLKTDKKIHLITVEKKGLLKEFKHRFKIHEYNWVYDDKKLAELYQATDLFLMPSEQEAFGLMAIEAMSCGVPVISIKGTSLESVTNSPECGLCCEKEEFVNELNRLIANENELKIRAEKSLKFAKENYNKEIYVKRMIEVYKDVIKNHQIDSEWQDVLEQMKKYNGKNYFCKTRVKFAKNIIWKVLYRIIIRPFLKMKYGKEMVKNEYDKRFT